MSDDSQQKTLLLLSDIPESMELLELALEDEYHIVKKLFCDNCLIALPVQSVDLILLDINITGSSGFDLCCRLRELPETDNVSIIILSALNQEKDIIAGFAAGAVDYITKPYKLSIVQARVRAQFKLLHAQQVAEKASRAKSEFLANMSHEIRTPLNAIIGMNRCALDLPLAVEVRKFLENVQVSADLLLSVINDVLDYSKIEAGRLELAERPFDLSEIMEQLAQTYLVAAQDRGNQIILAIDNQFSPTLIGDDQRLLQVLINLLGNAIKFTENGKIILKVGVKEEFATEVIVQFEVSDTGIGIPVEAQSTIFESFTQVDSTISRRYGGSGLGLAICQRLVGMMGGAIDFESLPGVGTVFSFTARLKKALKKTISPVELKDSPDRQISSTSLRILLVEDDQFNQKLAQLLLKKKGHQVTTVEDGLKALESLSVTSYDIVLMDLQMPGMDGISATKFIRECEKDCFQNNLDHRELGIQLTARIRGGHIPIVAMTANALSSDREKCQEAGMDDYISKPYQPNEIFKVLDALAGIEFQTSTFR